MDKPSLDTGKPARNRFALCLQLVALVKPMWAVMLFAIVTGVLGFLAAIFISITGIYGILAALGQYQGMGLVALGVLCVALGIVRGVLRYGEQLSNHYIAFNILALIRDQLFRALRRLSPAKLESRDKGNLIAVITTDVELMEVFYAHTISPVIIGVATSAIMVAYIGSFHWLFGLISAAGYLFLGVVTPLLISRFGTDSGRRQLRGFGQLNSLLLDSLRGLRELIQFQAGATRRKAIDAQTAELRTNQKELSRQQAMTGILISLAVIVFPIVLLLVAASLYRSGQIDFTAVLVPAVALYSSFGPVIALSSLANNLNLTFASGERVMDIIQEQPQVQDVHDGVDVDFHGLVCQDVRFGYPSADAVIDGISLTVPPSRITGLAGPSGSGKSTLLKLMMRFWNIDQGSIRLSGVELGGINTASLRSNQSLITQEPQLFNDTIAENIRIGRLDATREQIMAACWKASIHDMIVSLPKGYDTRVGELGDRLSSGEKQRICLARAFLHDAPMILLDEPTSNIDALNEGIILKSLKEESRNKAVVLVSHRPSTLRIADQVYSLRSGRLS